MSAIGFDIGNERRVIVAAKHGGIDVLLNDESQGETPAMVSFGEKQQFIGSALATANPKSTISHIKRLIGKLYNEVQEELKLLPFVTGKGPRGGVLIELEYLKQKWTFTPICRGVTAWPKPLQLMHDGTAIALGYGMYKTDFSDSGPTVVMFVDIGHCDTQVAVAAFKQGKMNILSHSFDQNLGEAPISIECLIGDTDVRGIITREEFENLSSRLLDRVRVPCIMALQDSGLSVDQVYTVELFGSGSRIQTVTRILTLFFHKKPTRTINASECVARGCALRCAMLSPTLHVLHYKNLQVSTTHDELYEAQKKEKILAEQDLKVEQTKDQRNTLESFVYDTRSKLSSAYKSFATDSEKEAIINSLKETEQWLYEDSDDESEPDYAGKFEDIKRAIAEKALEASVAKYRELAADSLSASKKEMFPRTPPCSDLSGLPDYAWRIQHCKPVDQEGSRSEGLDHRRIRRT
ncbi:hypothetical protein E3N88_37244 [Mikania micrantha]|uniref:Uncharacterized protein n=1 Tax=Mikania micrantha TaxID=192012 RepID=A0A5N6M615_9ASTR|nr:hypothetical protein E3N88_37244 [Mikania micrantha]